ncbi:MAG: NACHT domain-containing protein, partial [Planctomycetes bacterium]|nr:NACHT domain-containing protein [Planctomycetota bacterium]
MPEPRIDHQRPGDLILRMRRAESGTADELVLQRGDLREEGRFDAAWAPRDVLKCIGGEDLPAESFSYLATTIRKAGTAAHCPHFGSWLLRALESRSPGIHGEILKALNIPELQTRLVIVAGDECASAALPWEMLGTPVDGLAGTLRLQVVRFSHAGEPSPPVKHDPADRFRVLVLVAALEQGGNARKAEADAKATVDHISSALVDLGGCVEFVAAGGVPKLQGADGTATSLLELATIAPSGPPRGDSLAELLAGDGGFHVVHIVGHSNAGRALKDTRGTAIRFPFGSVPIAGDDPNCLRAMLAARTRLCVLECCDVPEATASQLLAAVDHVVAMAAMVKSELGARWCQPFYRHLFEQGEGQPASIGGAVAEARAFLFSFKSGDSFPYQRDIWIAQHHARSLDDELALEPDLYFERQYRRTLAKTCSKLELPFADGIDARDVLAQVYVELRVGADPHRARSLDLFEGHLADDLAAPPDPSATLAGLVRARRYRRLVLRGDPGSGKSTVLQHLALELADERPATLLPIRGSLRDWLRQGIRSVREFVRRDPEFQHAEARFERALAAGNVVLLLDGLDEVRRWTDADELVNRLDTELGSSILVLASRVVGYRRAGTDTAVEVDLQPLSADGRRELFTNWFRTMWATRSTPRASERPRFPGLLAPSFQGPEDATAAVLRVVDANPSLDEITGNPMAVALIARLFADPPANSGELPVRRHRIYAEMMRYLVRGEYRGEGLPKPVCTAVRTLLRHLALWMTKRGDTLIERGQPDDPTEDGDPLDAFLATLRDEPAARAALETLADHDRELTDT